MPMRRRSWTGSTPASYTSAPSSSTEPVTQPPSDSSCMRFRQRRKVLLPQPEGPITAVTVCAGNRRDTSFTTARRPYRAVSRTASSWSRASAGSAMTRSQGPAGRQGEDQHETHEHQRRGPGEAVPFVERAGPVGEDLQRQRLHRLQDARGEVQVAERREKQRRRLARDARHAHETAGEDPRQRGAGDDPQRGAPAWVTEGERRFAQRVRNQAHHFLRGAGDHRYHQDRKGHAPGQGGEVSHRPDQPCPGEDADDDRWCAVQNIRHEPDRPAEAARAVLGEVQSRPDADRQADQRRQSDDDQGPDDRVRHTAPRLAGRDRILDEEAPVERGSAFGDQIPEDEEKREHRNERQRGHQGGHGPADDAASQATRAHSARLPTAVPRATRQIMRRASAFTATVITNRMRPTSNNAERYRFVVASLNSFAIAA